MKPAAIKPTWEDLCELEPRLRGLRLRASALRRAAKEEPRFCANAHWYGYGRSDGLRGELRWLVGYLRRPEHPVLSTSEAYDVAYHTVYDSLPDCRHPESAW